ncbi:MAG: metallophosphoesterase [Bryobacterales bacterium]|nr:metallophosphoesterase [Bryobacterales bacterium]
MTERTHLELRPGILADCTGAVYLESSRALLVADAHLGYAWAQRRRGELGPLTDGGIFARIDAAMARWKPEQLVFLGDVVHLGRPASEEREAIEQALTSAANQARVTVVLGNHDRQFVSDFGHLPVETMLQWSDDNVLAVHGDREWPDTSLWLLMGHLHPSIRVQDAAGVRQRLPVFVIGSRAVVLPAFSPFAAGFDLAKPLSPEWRLLFGGEYVELAAATGTQVRKLPRLVSLRFQRTQAGGGSRSTAR